jgi:ribonuclease P protein component
VAESAKVFPRRERLRKRREFLRVYESGVKVKTKLFFIYLLENGLPYSRLGITVSRKVGKPIIRNQLKRRLREVFRRNKSIVAPPSDLIINASVVTATASVSLLEGEFRRVFFQKDGAKDVCSK